MKYKFSKYNHLFDVDNNHYVYNLLSTSIILLDDKLYSSFKESNVSGIDKKYVDSLFEEGFIVEQNMNENNMFEYYYDSKRYGDTSQVLRITIIPTSGCNLACPYCFEGNNKTNKTMTQQNIDSILKFIELQIEQSKNFVPINTIIMSFFGGEPLLCKDIIKYVCDKSYEIAKENHIDIIYDITTNLTLLDDEIINYINNYNIGLQVTIDGTKEQHDLRRIQHNGKGTYDLIIKNLSELVDSGLKDLICIRVNLDESNVKDASNILKNLKPFSNFIYFGYIMKYNGANDNYKNNCFNKNCYSSIATSTLYKAYQENGLRVPQEFGKKTPCPINSQNTFVINSNMDVYKCELLLEHKETKVGVITEDGYFLPNSNFYKQMSYSPLKVKKCTKCKMLPLCGAGCPAREYINNSKHNGNICLGECYVNEKDLTSYLEYYVKMQKNND